MINSLKDLLERHKEAIREYLLLLFVQILQLLPIWMMLTLQYVLNVNSNSIEYASNIFVYILVSIAAELYEGTLMQKKAFEYRLIRFLEILIFIFAIIFFVAILFSSDQSNSYTFKTDTVIAIAIVLCVVNIILSLITLQLKRVKKA